LKEKKANVGSKGGTKHKKTLPPKKKKNKRAGTQKVEDRKPPHRHSTIPCKGKSKKCKKKQKRKKPLEQINSCNHGELSGRQKTSKHILRGRDALEGGPEERRKQRWGMNIESNRTTIRR